MALPQTADSHLYVPVMPMDNHLVAPELLDWAHAARLK
jgi:hypothetical protein